MGNYTREIVEQFDRVFRTHDASSLSALIADDCVLENTGPAPDGAIYNGHDACVEFWTSIAANPDMNFETENIDIIEDRGIIQWRLHWGPKADQAVRGVNIMRVKDGKIVEALGYVKS